ncbi:MAG: hypothetical protein WCK05_13030 [Planctomycetota bacterium]
MSKHVKSSTNLELLGNGQAWTGRDEVALPEILTQYQPEPGQQSVELILEADVYHDYEKQTRITPEVDEYRVENLQGYIDGTRIRLSNAEVEAVVAALGGEQAVKDAITEAAFV